LTAIMGKMKRDKITNTCIREEIRMENIQSQIKGKWTEMVQTCQKNG
jgi:hypothetical protein